MRKTRTVFLAICFLTIVVCGLIYSALRASLPTEDGELKLPGLAKAVSVQSDTLGVPSIVASNREDAFRTLGYLHASDRLFQMELMRRKSAGRLAELFGASALKLDRKQRTYQLSRTASTIVQDLPAAQRQTLQAYVDGVNAYIEQARILPPEFLVLRHSPEPWRAEDSILVALGMFQTLNGQEQDERMVSVMEQALPADLLTFLTPDTDSYATVLVGGPSSRRFSQSIPVQAMAALPDADAHLAQNHVDADNVVAGSNNWVVAGSKTADGRAIVANDMHLGLGVPNIWYRADLTYRDKHIYGVTLPGLPAVVVGGNNDVAWGFTNVTADLVDLVRLELDTANPTRYRTPQGWREFAQHTETIKVKDAAAEDITLQDTVWGPVSDQLLLGQPVAVKWVALERHAVDLGLLEMDNAQSTHQAMTIMNNAGGPAQNVVFADTQGHIGWTYMGRFPKRVGFDGLASRSWADGNLAWQGYIPPDELPRLMDPAEGFIATANNRTLGSDYPHVIAHNWALGYRAFRIAELLRDHQGLTEQDLLAIQLDSRGGALDYFQQLALAELRDLPNKESDLQEVERALQAWDGHMRVNSIGAAFLQEFRKRLAEEVFAKVVAACRAHDPEFRYAWREMETPLRQLLTERPTGLLSSRYHDDWRLMIVDILRQTHEALHRQYPETDLAKLTWGQTHGMSLQHPFSRVAPLLGNVLDMPTFASDGCASVCVRVMDHGHGASERLVLSPAHPDDAIFHMPGGQSGHVLSPHYRDQQQSWQDGLATPLQADAKSETLSFVP
ncbi:MULTISPECIES: penicillin acylase family protein [Methylomonas]|uniref:Penicillin acylase n=2 Tax=Methylomonas TaxID=416 RepID=A0A140E3K9_9GAMM|nr:MULTISPECIES: penicillin acylase family protein [Methylomonas]AMK74983.1 penicillin acylase [Methylomonas denitrificans]OAI02626.1 penicillin acylase [Methylomonas methanica]TCV83207.1 penicillin amidase [Methylomonas methanica]